MALDLVSTVNVGSGGTSLLRFSNIPQTGKDLLLVASLRSSGNNNDLFFKLNDNNVTWSKRELRGDGSASSSLNTTSSNTISIGRINGNATTSNVFGTVTIQVCNYTAAANKLISVNYASENNATQAFSGITAGLWANTDAANMLDLYLSGDTIVQNSSASLYLVS